MATSTIPLAKGMDLSKMEWPAFLSIKYDGVPVKLTVKLLHDTISWEVVSRSGKPVPSVHVYAAEIADRMFGLSTVEDGVYTIVAEITHRWEKDFKDVSGIVRKQEPQPFLIWNVFDYNVDYAEPQPFHIRTKQAYSLIDEMRLPYVNYVEQKYLQDAEHAESTIPFMQQWLPEAEGFILVSADRTFKPNSRHWDYQKIVVDPTADLVITGFEEALSAKDENGVQHPLGMVGRLIADYNGKEIGVGPGKLTHNERRELWMNPYTPMIATIKYKRDPSYDSLRQPTFQHWREDKDEPNVD